MSEQTITQAQSRPVGRPTKMTDENVGKLRTAFLMGCDDNEACAYAEIHRTTLYDYQLEHPEFTDMKEAWKQNPILEAKHTIFDDLKNPDTAKWYLERKLKGEFSTRHENVNYDMNKVDELLDTIETDYDDVANKAKRQMVETKQLVQGEEQAGTASDIQAQHNAATAPSGQGQP